jgi:hypothetical protein
VTFGSIFSLL